MKKTLLTLALGLILVGCAPSRHWAPDSVYTETSTYDDGDHLYQEVGVSGTLGKSGVRMDLFGVGTIDTNRGSDNYFGGGIRFEIPLK